MRARQADTRAGRPGRGRALRRAVQATVLAVTVASCGTIPPDPASTASPSSHLFTPSPRATSPSPGGTTPTPSTSPTPVGSATGSPTAPSTPEPSATKPAPKPPPDTWVGHFRGLEIFVPRGHGATMSFTFDDGPWPGSTAQVLALLEQHHVHAVFCLIGTQARVHPSLVRREVAGGHELCDHSRDHDLRMRKRKQRYVDAEVGDGLAQIRRAAPPGTPVTFYRQPGGTWSPKVVHAMNRYGLGPLRWSDDPRDWSRPGSTVIVRRVVAQLHPGAVVLMHDGGGDRSQSVEALQFLLGAVVAAGWKPVLAPHVRLSPQAAAKPQ